MLRKCHVADEWCSESKSHDPQNGGAALCKHTAAKVNVLFLLQKLVKVLKNEKFKL